VVLETVLLVEVPSDVEVVTVAKAVEMTCRLLASNPDSLLLSHDQVLAQCPMSRDEVAVEL
jgi:hypothetical protein